MAGAFYIYYFSGQDPLQTVAYLHSWARLAARDCRKVVCIADVDLNFADQAARRFWDGAATIQCVTVRADVVVERRNNPTRAQVRAMIAAL